MRLGCLFLLLLTSCLPLFGGENPQSPEVPSSLAQFDDWWQKYSDAPDAARPAMVKKGIALAVQRKADMFKLIESDPQSAIKFSFPEEFRTSLPQKIQPLIEENIRGLATLTVTPGKDGEATRSVTMDDQSWQAYMFGARLNLASREEIPIHGIALDGHMAVDGSPLERFPERASLVQALTQSGGKKSCPVCGRPGVIPAAVGDALLWFDTPEDLATTEKALIEKESKPEVKDYPK